MTRRGSSAVDRQRTYNLLCIVQHKGSAAYSGHYVADILHSDNTWKRYDDQFVTPVRSSETRAFAHGLASCRATGG